MTTKDFDLIDRGDKVVKATEALEDETDKLAALNDEPRLRQDEVEGFFAAVIRVIMAALKH